MIEGIHVAAAAIGVGGAALLALGLALRGERRDARRMDPGARAARRP
jgi:hypothetical protein